jgi:cell wall-associated NlpC family hydrolase
VIEPDLLITTGVLPIPAGVRQQIRADHRVQASLLLASGQLRTAGASVFAISADPGQLRAWTPTPTAASNALWAGIASGQVAASYDAAKNLHLVLGAPLPLQAAQGRVVVPTRLGALASTGLPGVDLTVNAALGRELALTADSALLLSAPGTDLEALRDQLAHRFGAQVHVTRLHQDSIVRDAGAFLTRAQLTTVVHAALAKVGAPYVWGATGPTSFDCSGLIGYAYAAAGIRLPRTSEQMWLAGRHIRPQDARAGDLLFWANDPAAPHDIDHVALYLGNGLMVAAPHTGDVVHVSTVYSSNFQGVVRIDPAAATRLGGPLWTTT